VILVSYSKENIRQFIFLCTCFQVNLVVADFVHRLLLACKVIVVVKVIADDQV
jgi:hypothetical protein